MTKEKKRILIAQLCGWNPRPPCYDGKIRLWRNEESKPPRTREFSELPDYFNDLNSMLDAEKQVVWGHGWTQQYYDKLREICKRDFIESLGATSARPESASASQRAESLLATIGLLKQR